MSFESSQSLVEPVQPLLCATSPTPTCHLGLLNLRRQFRYLLTSVALIPTVTGILSPCGTCRCEGRRGKSASRCASAEAELGRPKIDERGFKREKLNSLLKELEFYNQGKGG